MSPASHRAGSEEGWMPPRSFKLQVSKGEKAVPTRSICLSCLSGDCVDVVDVSRPAAFLQSWDGQGEACSEQNTNS